jgi:hypothetical protein
VQRYYTYFHIYNWPWLCYLGNKINSLVNQCCCWTLNNKILLTSKSFSTRLTFLVWTPSACDIIFLKIYLCSFILENDLCNLLKFNQSCKSFSRKMPIVSCGPIWRASSFWSYDVHIHQTAAYEGQYLKYWIWIKSIWQFMH